MILAATSIAEFCVTPVKTAVHWTWLFRFFIIQTKRKTKTLWGFLTKPWKSLLVKWILKIKACNNHIYHSNRLRQRYSHVMTKESVKKSTCCTFRAFVLPYYKICCLVFIFLFLSSASQSQKTEKTISTSLFSNPFSYITGQNSLFVLLGIFKKVLRCQNMWYWYVIMML